MAFGKKDKPDKKKGGRFRSVGFNGAMPMYSVVVDTQTGVNYLVVSMGMEAIGVTVMVDAQGNPIVTPVSAAGEDA